MSVPHPQQLSALLLAALRQRPWAAGFELCGVLPSLQAAKRNAERSEQIHKQQANAQARLEKDAKDQMQQLTTRKLATGMARSPIGAELGLLSCCD